MRKDKWGLKSIAPHFAIEPDSKKVKAYYCFLLRPLLLPLPF